MYVVVVSALGFAGLVIAVLHTPWATAWDWIVLWPTLFLAAAAVAGEVRPVGFVYGTATVRYLSTSAPFVLALIAVAGVGIAVVVQVVASLLDDILNRRSPIKSLFNTFQYAVSVFLAGALYTWITDAPLFDSPAALGGTHLPALLAAGVAMVAANWLLVAGVVTLATNHPFFSVLRADATHTLITQVVLLSVGGIAAEVAAQSVLALSLLIVPVVAAHVFSSAAAKHAYDATHDSLTDLGNREQAARDLTGLLTATRTSRDEGAGLVLLDLDHFKDINDTLGHPVGDRTLIEVARRLVEAAPPSATVHRLGGDEFAVVMVGDVTLLRDTAETVLVALDEPVQIERLELLIRASVGVAVAPVHGSDTETLMKNADIALYHAKVERDRISVYSPDFDVNTVERLRLLADLRAGLEAGDLHVVYQPQVDLADGTTVAMEALVRWEHPSHGLISPDDFIPLAENSGLIVPVTAYVLDHALEALRQWQSAGHDPRISVNLSARHLSDLDLVDQVSAALARHEIRPSSLVLEVTETGILSDAGRADAVIRALRELGVEIAIDDYGTGNASLSYLRRLQVDELKVDRSFVSRLTADEHDLIIVRSTVELAIALGLRVVAEGVEDATTAEALSGFGAVIAQGYHFGRPMTREEIGRRLDEERSASASNPQREGR